MSLFPVNFKTAIIYSQTALYHCLQAIHSTIENILKASPFLPHITILCITFIFTLHLIQTESTSILQQALFCSILLTTIIIFVTTFSIIRILEGTWYIKAKVSISKQPKALILVDFEPFDWAHFNPVAPPLPQQEEQQDNWTNWD